MYPSEGIDGYTRDQFIADLLTEHESEIRRCLAKGAYKVQIDFTEGRLATRNDARNPWTGRGMLPHFIEMDWKDVLEELRGAGYPFQDEWFAPHLEFRFPLIGSVSARGVTVELRHALEPWNVLGEEASGGGTARNVDSSVERIQVKVTGSNGGRFVVLCNGRRIPEPVGGVRYRAWQPPSCLHPRIPVHTPLVFDIIDTWSSRAIAGCQYHVSHPGGRANEDFPVNANEAESRRLARFSKLGHTPGPMVAPPEESNPDFPFTLDLRRAAK